MVLTIVTSTKQTLHISAINRESRTSHDAQDAGFGETMPGQMTPTSSTQSVLDAYCAYALRRSRSAVIAVCWRR